MNKAILTGLVMACAMIGACGAAKWKEPYSWTLREDGRLRASQRNENFSFAEWKAKYLSKEGAQYGVAITPAGAAAIAAELSRRDAKIIELENKLSECR